MTEQDFTIRCRVFAVGERVRRIDAPDMQYTVCEFIPPTEEQYARVRTSCGRYLRAIYLEPDDPQPEQPMPTPQFERRKVEIEYDHFAVGADVINDVGDVYTVHETLPACEEWHWKSKVIFAKGRGWQWAHLLKLRPNPSPEPPITPEEIVAAMKHGDYMGIDRHGDWLRAVQYESDKGRSSFTDGYKTDLEALHEWVRVLRARERGGQ